jgi:acetylglutamate kinase
MSSRAEAGTKASTLVEALPYMRRYRGQTVVAKVGGAALDDARLATLVADDLALLSLVGIRLVVVHGGGPQVSDAMRTRGVEPRFVEGLRVTDDETVEVVRQVLVGSINGDAVSRLARAGLKAVGLWGGDGGCVTATPAEGPDGQDIGHVGSVSFVEPHLLETLLAEDYTPVLASVAPDVGGNPLNVNADEIASAVAVALGAAKLVYLTNVEGLYRDLGRAESLVSELKLDEAEQLVGELSAGMRPKVRSAIAALRGGVEKVHILDGRVEHALLLEIFTEDGIGTQVLA